MEAPPDDVLLSRCRSGDVEAYGELVQRYQQAVFNVCYRMLEERREAEDLTQESFLRAYRKLDKREEARDILEQMLAEFPTFRPALDEMMKMLVQQQDAGGMITVLQRWVKHNPQDIELKEALKELLDQIDKLERPAGDSQ